MKEIILNKKGSALTIILLIMVIMTVISMGIISNSVNNLEQSTVIVESERAYYASEDSAQLAIATIKDEVSRYYMGLQQASSYASYVELYNDLFTYLSNRVTGENSILSSPNFIDSQLSGNTTISCTMDAPVVLDSGLISATFHVISTTVLDNTPRVVEATLTVEAEPVVFMVTTAPKITTDILLVGGNVEISRENNENAMTVSGSARIGGIVTDTAAFGATTTRINDSSVSRDLTWKLFYDQFDTSIANPAMPEKVYPEDANLGNSVLYASNNYSFDTSTEITNGITGKNVYCNGTLTIIDADLTNSNIYATGDIIIMNSEWALNGNGHQYGNSGNHGGSTFYRTNLYAEGNIYLAVRDVEYHSNHIGSMYAGNDITIVIGDGYSSGTINYARITAGGDLSISSCSTSYYDELFQSQFYATGSITLESTGWMYGPKIDDVDRCTFETRNGDIILTSYYLDRYNKVHSGDDIYIAARGTDNSAYYADGTITIDSSGISSPSVSDTSIFCAQDGMTIENSKFDDCYFYSGNTLDIYLESGETIEDSIMYAEGNTLLSNYWTGGMNTIADTLIYTRGNFTFGGMGTVFDLEPAGLQLMVEGNVYSYEDDDTYSNQDLFIFGIGDNMQNNLSEIHSNIGDPDPNLNILADELNSVGFEHESETVIIALPYYSEIFVDEIHN